MNNIPVSRSWVCPLILFLGFGFLYIPMLVLIIYSFNSSRLVTVWAGWSTQWYGELFRDEMMMKAVALSVMIAVMAATSAVVLGTISAFVLTRMGRRFRGANGFAFMITAPLVMPEVITGLSLLLLFVAISDIIGWPSQRGMSTIWIAHTTFCTAYVAVVVSSRLRELENSIAEAAMDLGARPLKVFFVITLPLIAPAIIAGWLLAFTLSLDDLAAATGAAAAAGAAVATGFAASVVALVVGFVAEVARAVGDGLGRRLCSRGSSRRRFRCGRFGCGRLRVRRLRRLRGGDGN